MANRLLYESFDNQSGAWDIDNMDQAPSFGSFSLDRAGEGYSWGVGRGGVGQCLLGDQNSAVGTYWSIFGDWPTDYVYISYWLKYTNCTDQWVNENVKQMYFNSGTAEIRKSTVVTHNFNGNMFIDCTKEGGANWGVWWGAGNTSIHCDGNWHHWEMYYGLTEPAIFKLWFDRTDPLNIATPDIDSTCVDAGWDYRYLNSIAVGSIDGQEDSIFRRWIDDIEIWDGMPDTTMETFEDVIGNWIVETDTSGVDSTVTKSSDEAKTGTYSAKCFSTNSGAKAQVRDIIDSPWADVPSADPGEFIWQHAWIYVPSATANAITGSEYIDLASFYVSSTNSGWYLRLVASAGLHAVGPSAAQTEFNIYATMPLDQWVELEIGLNSQNIEAGGRSFIVFINGDCYGWYRYGAKSTDYDRVAMGIVSTNSDDDLTIYIDDWTVFTSLTTPNGTDNRLTSNLSTIDFTSQNGKNIGFQYHNWDVAGNSWMDSVHGATQESTGFSPNPNTDKQEDNLEDGWAEIVIDWAHGNEPDWPVTELSGTFYGSMVAFKKYIPDEENLEITCQYNQGGSGKSELVYDSWNGSQIVHSKWDLPFATTHSNPLAKVPEPGDKIRVRWKETSATDLRIRVDYYDASIRNWYLDVIDDTRDMSNINGVNWLDHKHHSVTTSIITSEYTIQSMTYGTFDNFPENVIANKSPSSEVWPIGAKVNKQNPRKIHPKR